MAHYEHSLELKKGRGVEETLAPLKRHGQVLAYRKCLRDEGYEAANLLEQAEQGEVDDWFGGWRGERNEDYPWMENDEFVNANEEMWRRQVLLDMWNSSNFIEDDDQTIEEDDDVVMAKDLLKTNPSK
ncbi:hypothetical protein B9Z55_012330 [Caenorhabditis nigoni]|uniref:Uncharacterized protein n=1 Tax=Caenorhabditis nigoni TaxID=1611254 RepID=A0A2G5TX95_9PELO|nr:hypothetical protein B9Z55_012330 [Caenorhabditis nigoni]